jgi:hypothetical protein
MVRSQDLLVLPAGGVCSFCANQRSEFSRSLGPADGEFGTGVSNGSPAGSRARPAAPTPSLSSGEREEG